MVSPPKPWERGPMASTPAASTAATIASSSSSTLGADYAATPSSASNQNVPSRPPALTNAPASAAPGLTNANPYNPLSSYNSSFNSGYNSPYSSFNRFGSGYSGYGGYGGGMYGGMGMGGYGMNGMGYGMGYGMNGMGYGMPGMPMDPNNPSLTQTLESTTQQTFALLHSIVQTFTGLSQMVESTFMATHSSFFAMVGVIDQFSRLRDTLGSVLGLFGLLRWLKELLLGRRRSNPLRNEFRDFVNGRPVPSASTPPGPKPSKAPLIIFLLAVFGVPYAMHKLIKALLARAPQSGLPGQNAFDPSSLTFARAKFPFTAATAVELSLKENEIVAILGKLDPNTGMEVDPHVDLQTEWWKGCTRDGREGWFPSQWVEIIERKKPEAILPTPAKTVPESS